MSVNDSVREVLEFKLEMLTERRARVYVGRTIKTSKDTEFSKFDLELEGTLPENVDAKQAMDTMFRELMSESILRESAIRAAYGDSTRIERLVSMLRSIMDTAGGGDA